MREETLGRFLAKRRGSDEHDRLAHGARGLVIVITTTIIIIVITRIAADATSH